MTTLQFISLYSMATLYCLAGVTHFLQPKMYIGITPKWVPSPEKVNVLVGSIELILGVSLLFEATRSLAAIGIIVLLFAVLPANINHYQLSKRSGKFVIPTLIRIPIQAVLIYWAFLFV